MFKVFNENLKLIVLICIKIKEDWFDERERMRENERVRGKSEWEKERENWLGVKFWYMYNNI